MFDREVVISSLSGAMGLLLNSSFGTFVALAFGSSCILRSTNPIYKMITTGETGSIHDILFYG